MGRKFVSIAEFRTLAQLSESETLHLLSRGSVKFARGPGGELLIDLDSLDAQALSKQIVLDVLDSAAPPAAAEAVAAAAVSVLDELIAEAAALAFTWLREDQEHEPRS